MQLAAIYTAPEIFFYNFQLQLDELPVPSPGPDELPGRPIPEIPPSVPGEETPPVKEPPSTPPKPDDPKKYV